MNDRFPWHNNWTANRMGELYRVPGNNHWKQDLGMFLPHKIENYQPNKLKTWYHDSVSKYLKGFLRKLYRYLALWINQAKQKGDKE